MGIRFKCPNGHKLNVKTELAGKFGICPHCGVRMEIPFENTRESEKKQTVEENLRLAEDISNPDTDQSRLFPLEEPAVEEEKSSQHTSPLEPPPAQSQMTGSSILDDMTVVWYVQAANGQRFGPATGPIIKTWILEKRIGPTMLVWREGWPEWLQAKHVFPEVAQMFKPAGEKEKAVPPPIENVPKPSQPDSKVKKETAPGNPKTHPEQPMFDLSDFGDLGGETNGLELEPKGLGRRSPKKPIENFGLIVGFVVLIVIMLIVLAAVLVINTRQKPSKKLKSNEKTVSFESADRFPFSIT